MRKDTILILDPGHGGVIKGEYVTAPAKMHTFKDGFTVYEGQFNRQIAKKLEYRLKTLGIPVHVLVPNADDMPLKERVEKANKLAKVWGGKAIYVSIHANGGGGTGFEVYTSKGETKSDIVADFYMEAMSEQFPDKAARVDLSDGDKDKEAGFYVLKNTSCPAILTESFFMDTRSDAELMTSYNGQEKIVNAHLSMIEKTLSVDIFTMEPKAKKKPELTPEEIAKKEEALKLRREKAAAKKAKEKATKEAAKK